MSGLAVVLGADRSPNETLVQVAGSGHRVKADALRKAMADEPAIRERFLRYAQAFAVQVAYATLAQGRHGLQKRLARWLLMCHDRAEGDALVLTQRVIARALGTHCTRVTLLACGLQERGLIRATRGRICILDRTGLEALARGLYGAPEAEYARLMGEERSVGQPVGQFTGRVTCQTANRT